jgi:hypothetical protein
MTDDTTPTPGFDDLSTRVTELVQTMLTDGHSAVHDGNRAAGRRARAAANDLKKMMTPLRQMILEAAKKK